MRTELIASYLSTGLFAVTPAYLTSVINIVNSGEIAKAETNQEFSESHSYEVIGNVAVITIDGATTKKNTWMNALCGGMIGYDTIATYVKQADADDTVTKTLLVVDTRGGDVDGVDGLAELIYNAKNETHTLYDNVGASAGIWWGSASDNLHATRTTVLGSIGVMAGYSEPTDDGKVKIFVSENAENKNCSLNGDCQDKIKERINSAEAIFHERVSRNTGLKVSEIISEFNKGGVIDATKALDIGFLDTITTYEALLSKLNDSGVNPTMGQIAKHSVKDVDNSTQGNAMTLEEAIAALNQANTTIEARDSEIAGLNTQVTDFTANAAEQVTAIATLTANATAQAALTAHAIQSGFKMGADEETMLAMVTAKDVGEASTILLAAKTSDGSTSKSGEQTAEQTAKEEAEKLEARCMEQGITALGKVD